MRPPARQPFRHHGQRGRRGRGAPHPYGPRPTSWRPQYQPRASFCAACQTHVRSLAQHRRVNHDRKQFGYMCEVCGHFEGQFDRHLFEKHLKTHQPSPDITRCVREVAGGYERAERCTSPGCHFKAPSQFELGRHAASAHATPPPLAEYFTVSYCQNQQAIATLAAPTAAPAVASTAPATPAPAAAPTQGTLFINAGAGQPTDGAPSGTADLASQVANLSVGAQNGQPDFDQLQKLQ